MDRLLVAVQQKCVCLEEARVTGEQLMSVEGFTDRGYKLPAHLEI